MASILLLLLSSCSYATTCWDCATTTPPSKGYYPAGQIVYRPAGTSTKKLILRLVQSSECNRLYVESYARLFPISNGDSSTTLLTISFKDGEEKVFAQRMEGGQRALLPDSIRDRIVENLLSDLPVQITSSYTTVDFIPDGFSKALDTLQDVVESKNKNLLQKPTFKNLLG